MTEVLRAQLTLEYNLSVPGKADMEFGSNEVQLKIRVETDPDPRKSDSPVADLFGFALHQQTELINFIVYRRVIMLLLTVLDEDVVFRENCSRRTFLPKRVAVGIDVRLSRLCLVGSILKISRKNVIDESYTPVSLIDSLEIVKSYPFHEKFAILCLIAAR